MSDSIDLGIDLGTTNSVVAYMNDIGRPEIARNENDNELTPSFVAVNSRGEIEVGLTAKNLQLEDPDNCANGFKRNLNEAGNGWRFTPPANGETYSAVELSSILLRELCRNAAVALNENPSAAVITVPAAFGEVEKRNLMEAGREAGLIDIHLVQEPVAAGLAYGWDRSEDNKAFLIYDIGGGTFDLSLMRCEEGQLVVMSHKGEAVGIGGRDIDAWLLDDIVLPKLKDRVSQEELTARRAVLLWLCEEAKIRLSRSDSVAISIEGRITSIDGEPITDVITVNRHEDLEPLLIPLLTRTSELIDEMLVEESINESDLSAIVLVGGPSRTPALRKFLEDRYEVEIHTRIDPMTVVAQGAALYSASILKTSEGLPSPTPGTIPIRISFEPVSSISTAPVAIAADPTEIPNESTFRITKTDRSWASGSITIHDGRAITQVVLTEREENKFNIQAFAPSGVELELSPNEFKIIHGLSAAPPPLSRSIGVILEGATESELSFGVIGQRGESTPFRGRRSFRTTKAIIPGDESEEFVIHFREGENKNPLRNASIGQVVIRPGDLTRPLSAGEEVIITIRIDPSKDAEARVEIPVLGMTLENRLERETEYAVSINDAELNARLYAELARVSQLRSGGRDTEDLESIAEDVQHQFKGAGQMDQDDRQRAHQRLELLEVSVDRKVDDNAPEQAFTDLDACEEQCTSLVEAYGDAAEQQELQRLKSQASRARETADHELAKKTTEMLFGVGGSVYWSQDGVWISKFQELAENEQLTDPQRAAYLVQQGRSALNIGDINALREAVLGLEQLLEGPQHDPLSMFRGLRE